MVTVIIATRDRPDLLLSRALPTALAQQGVAFDVVVVDDGSNAAFELPDDPRVRMVRRAAPRGVAAARNTGLRAAGGEWVAFLDDDDLWSPRKLREQLAVLEDGGEFCFASAVVVDADRMLPLINASAPKAAGLVDALVARNVIPAGSSNMLIRRQALIDIGGFDESFSYLDDWDCWLRLAARYDGRVCPLTLVAYLIQSASRVQANPASQFEEFDRLRAKHAALAATSGSAFDRQDFARYLAVGQRRAGRPLAAAKIYLHSAWSHRSAGDLVRAGLALSRVAPRRHRNLSTPDWLAAQTRS